MHANANFFPHTWHVELLLPILLAGGIAMDNCEELALEKHCTVPDRLDTNGTIEEVVCINDATGIGSVFEVGVSQKDFSDDWYDLEVVDTKSTFCKTPCSNNGWSESQGDVSKDEVSCACTGHSILAIDVGVVSSVHASVGWVLVQYSNGFSSIDRTKDASSVILAFWSLDSSGV